jgi:hypothetical protein
MLLLQPNFFWLTRHPHEDTANNPYSNVSFERIGRISREINTSILSSPDLWTAQKS